MSEQRHILTQIGSLDLVKQRIKVRGAMGGGEDPHALRVQRRHKHDQRLLRYWFPIPPPLFAPKGPDQELVGCRRWRKARIPRDRQLFAQLGQVSRGVPIRHATRERHMRAAFATDDALGNPPDGKRCAVRSSPIPPRWLPSSLVGPGHTLPGLKWRN
jgi:hypothetical protein